MWLQLYYSHILVEHNVGVTLVRIDSYKQQFCCTVLLLSKI